MRSHSINFDIKKQHRAETGLAKLYEKMRLCFVFK